MKADEWNRRVVAVRDRMAAYVWQRTSPVAAWNSDNRGYLVGTANYTRLFDGTYLVSCEHVFRDAREGEECWHLPAPGDEFVAVPSTGQCPWPVDVAMARLDFAPDRLPHQRIEGNQFDEVYAPVEREILFFVGFPGSSAGRFESVTDLNRRINWFDGPIDCRAVPFALQAVEAGAEELASLRGFRKNEHIGIHFPGLAAINEQEESELPNPKGLSGSLLWDTKFVANGCDLDRWKPTQARVCGIVRAAHNNPAVVVASRADVLVPALIRMLRLETAFLSWCGRGCAHGNHLADWLSAEDTIRGLTKKDETHL